MGNWSSWSSRNLVCKWNISASSRLSWTLSYGSSTGGFFCCLNLGTFATASKLYFMIQVIFLHPAPLHPHIYSNGHICLGTFKFLTFIAIYDLLCISGYLVVVLGGIKSMEFAGRTLLCLLGLGWFIQSDKYCLRVILFWFSCGRIPN